MAALLRSMRVALSLLLATILSHTAAQAGPWPRDAGAWFLSAQGVAEWGGGTVAHRTARLYGEHGLTPRLTLGGKVELGEGGHGGRAGEVFARWHPAHPFDWLEIGVELALGARQEWPAPSGAAHGRETEMTHRASLHLGRSLESPIGNGWGRLSLSAIGAGQRRFVEREIHAQLGLRPTEGTLAMVSASAYRDAYDTTLKLTPAIGRDFGNGYTAVMEFTISPSLPTRALSLGLWREF